MGQGMSSRKLGGSCAITRPCVSAWLLAKMKPCKSRTKLHRRIAARVLCTLMAFISDNTMSRPSHYFWQAPGKILPKANLGPRRDLWDDSLCNGDLQSRDMGIEISIKGQIGQPEDN